MPGIGHNVSIRDAGKQVGDYILDRSKTLYKQIDDATGNRFQPLADKIDAVNQKLRDVTNDKDEQDLLINKKRYELQLDQVFDDAASKGISRQDVAQAKSDFKKAQAIYDINDQIAKASAEGVRPGNKGASINPERVNPDALQKKLNALENSGRIQQGIGPDNTEELINHATTAKVAEKKVARNRRIGIGLATGLGGGELIRTAVH